MKRWGGHLLHVSPVPTSMLLPLYKRYKAFLKFEHRILFQSPVYYNSKLFLIPLIIRTPVYLALQNIIRSNTSNRKKIVDHMAVKYYVTILSHSMLCASKHIYELAHLTYACTILEDPQQGLFVIRLSLIPSGLKMNKL